MSGVETIGKLREDHNRHDLVVGLTGNALLSDQNEYLKAGVDRYVKHHSFQRLDWLIIFLRCQCFDKTRPRKTSCRYVADRG